MVSDLLSGETLFEYKFGIDQVVNNIAYDAKKQQLVVLGTVNEADKTIKVSYDSTAKSLDEGSVQPFVEASSKEFQHTYMVKDAAHSESMILKCNYSKDTGCLIAGGKDADFIITYI